MSSVAIPEKRRFSGKHFSESPARNARIVRLAIPTFPFAIQLKDSERK
jgi:hypothetical protein